METRDSLSGDFAFGVNDRRFAFSRQALFQLSQEPGTPILIDSSSSTRPILSRSDSGIGIPRGHYCTPQDDKFSGKRKGSAQNVSSSSFIFLVFGTIRSGHRYLKKLLLMISLNVAYSTAELMIGLFTGLIGLVFDAFHLTFGCGVLTIAFFVMAASRRKAERDYTFG